MSEDKINEEIRNQEGQTKQRRSESERKISKKFSDFVLILGTEGQ